MRVWGSRADIPYRKLIRGVSVIQNKDQKRIIDFLERFYAEYYVHVIEITEEGCEIMGLYTAVYERTTRKYGERGVRYVHLEVGHAARNVYLQAVSLGLVTVVVGAFDDDEVGMV